jgi:hypothetical protein
MRSDFTRLGYGIDGTGVKIGVISNSYNTRGAAATDVQYGDLPGSNNPDGYTKNVDVLKDIDPSSGIVMSDEGRAMLQIIHDIAPGAELAFYTGSLGEQDMAAGIRAPDPRATVILLVMAFVIYQPFFALYCCQSSRSGYFQGPILRLQISGTGH